MAGDILHLDDLTARYRAPSRRAAGKVRSVIDEASRRFIEHCPLVMVATAGADGRCDTSPRGGPPGFVSYIDERRVAIPDLTGNNRLDSYRNIISNPHAGLLFVVPGKDETVRINGPAHLTDDPTILDGFIAELRRPKLALVVEVEELFAHCAKALRRALLWDPGSWEALVGAPDLAEIYACQFEGMEEAFL
jgi:hypothetical protein